MALRSFFAIIPGLPHPAQFRPAAVPLLAAQELWEHARACPPSLLFRVRSESDAGALLSTADRLESCVGVIDSTTRWRAIFAMATPIAGAIQHPKLRGLCGQVLRFAMSAHPANVTAEERMAIASELQKLLAETEEAAPHPFEKAIAGAVGAVAMSDNDVEAAHHVPFVGALCPFSQEDQRQEYQGRMATLETLSGAVLLTEAFRRLTERMPIWLAAAMPALAPGGVEKEEEEDD